MISVHFQGKAFNITVIKAIKVYAPTSNTEEAETEWFYEDLQDLLELTPKKDVQQLRGATPHPRSGSYMGAGGPRGATPHSRSGGVAVIYPSSKVRSSGCALLEQL